MNRRDFLLGSATAGIAAGAQSRQGTGKPARALPLWGDENALAGFGPADDKLVAAFVAKCARHGVTRLVPSGGSRRLVEAAHASKIEVHPYAAFNSHGRNALRYGWSLDFFDMDPALPEARALFDRHRPIWGTPTSSLAVGEFAKAHPEFWSLRRDRKREVPPGERVVLSLEFPEVRRYEIDRYVKMAAATGGDGVQLEFTPRAADATGTDMTGYDDGTLGAFERKHGRSALALANDAPEWVGFRADQVTGFMDELRREMRQSHPGVQVSVTLVAKPRDRYRRMFQDWPAWASRGLVDALYLWFRTTSDVREVERFTKEAADQVRGRCPLIVELSCYHVGSFQDPKLLLEAARRALGSGAAAVGVYRSHSVEQLGLWPALEKIARL